MQSHSLLRIESECLANSFCETRSVLLMELCEKTTALADNTSRIVELAALDGHSMARDRSELAELQSQWEALFDKSREARNKLDVHRSEHGC